LYEVELKIAQRLIGIVVVDVIASNEERDDGRALNGESRSGLRERAARSMEANERSVTLEL
jgi:hypothetical protein